MADITVEIPTGGILIPLDRYEELVALEARVNSAVGLIAMDGYISTKELLLILGTELACEKVAEMREEENKRREEMNKKYEDITYDSN